MADEQKKYTYPDDTNTSEYSNSAVVGSTENIKSILMSKRFLTVAGIAALMFFIMIKRDYAQPVKAPEPPPVVKDAPKLPAPVVSVPEPQPPAISPETVQTINNTMSDVNSLATRMSDVEGVMAQVSSQQQNNVSTLNNLQTDLTNIQKMLTQLVEKPKAAVVHAPIPLQSYVIKAVIHGRAWIASGDYNRTVIVGDVIPTYGEVIAIYPDEGFIETSSGRNIMFDQNSV